VKYDLLAIDLDGTLLDSQHRLVPANREALHRAHQAGMRIVICTGRSFTETRPVLADIGLDLDAAVSVFGAIITEVATGRTLDRTPLPLDVARAATDWFQQLGYPVLWLTDADEVGFDGYLIDGPHRHPGVDRWLALSPCQVERVAALPPRPAAPVRLSIIDDERALPDLSTRLHTAFNGRLTHNLLHAPPYRLSLIEAFAPQVNKWYAVHKLCQRWGLDPRRTVAIGDDVNDVQMIRNAGLGVAMGNAAPAVKAVADQLTATNDDAGVALVIDRLLNT